MQANLSKMKINYLIASLIYALKRTWIQTLPMTTLNQLVKWPFCLSFQAWHVYIVTVCPYGQKNQLTGPFSFNSLLLTVIQYQRPRHFCVRWFSDTYITDGVWIALNAHDGCRRLFSAILIPWWNIIFPTFCIGHCIFCDERYVGCNKSQTWFSMY